MRKELGEGRERGESDWTGRMLWCGKWMGDRCTGWVAWRYVGRTAWTILCLIS